MELLGISIGGDSIPLIKTANVSKATTTTHTTRNLLYRFMIGVPIANAMHLRPEFVRDRSMLLFCLPALPQSINLCQFVSDICTFLKAYNLQATLVAAPGCRHL